MVRWEYALLVRRRQAAAGTEWMITFTWYGPDGLMQDVTALGDTALAHLNRAGAGGWELVAAEEDINNLQGTTEVFRYHLKRPLPAA